MLYRVSKEALLKLKFLTDEHKWLTTFKLADKLYFGQSQISAQTLIKKFLIGGYY